MADYLELPLTSDATALSDVGKDYLSDNIEGWEPRPGNVESILMESGGQMSAEVVDQAAQVPPIAFAYYGEWLLGIGLREATPATSTVTITFAVGAVVTVPEGYLLAAPNPDGESYAFQTDAEVRSDAADKTTTVTALEPGANANGCVGECEPIDTVDDVATIVMAPVATGGTDEETGDEYLDRLADALTILAPRPILPQDFATMARQVPGVGRALAIDLFQPPASAGGFGQPRGPEPNGATNVPRCVTVAITAEEGTPPSQALMQLAWETLDAAREVNFLSYVIPPSYTTIDVEATVVAFPGYTLAEVQAAATEMMQTWLDPATWGSEAVGEVESWALQTKARIYEAVDYLNRAGGVHYVETVKLGTGGAPGTVDIPLTGFAPLPKAGTITITVLPAS